MRRDKHSGVLSVGMLMVGTVCMLWTVITGEVAHWAPCALAIGVVLYLQSQSRQ